MAVNKRRTAAVCCRCLRGSGGWWSGRARQASKKCCVNFPEQTSTREGNLCIVHHRVVSRFGIFGWYSVGISRYFLQPIPKETRFIPLLFAKGFLAVVPTRKKISVFWDLGFEPQTKMSLAMVASLHYLPATSLTSHIYYYIPTYLQARCVSCRVSLAATHTAMPPVIFAPTN